MIESPKLCQAAFDGDFELVKKLLSTGVDVNLAGQGWNPLHCAIENEQPDLARLLIGYGADKERINSEMTPLAHAVEVECDAAKQQGLDFDSCSTDMIDLLLKAGCDPKSGIDMAISERNHKLQKFITDYKASEQDTAGQSATVE